MMRNPYGILRFKMARALLAMLCIAVAACDTDSLLDEEPTTPGEGPTVSVQTQLPQRAGRNDSLHVTVTAAVQPPVASLTRVGIAVRQGQTLIVRSADVSGQATATRTLAFHVGDLTPDAQGNISFQVFGWAIDAAGNCTLVGANATAVDCSTQGGEPVIAGVTGIAANLLVIAARQLKIAPTASQIGDIVVDTKRSVVYVTNKATSSVDIVSWSGASLVRGGSVRVGSLPWGMTLDRSGDTLIVANSGGTSLSYVDLNGLREAQRYQTPNAVLYQLTPDDSGTVVLEHIDFSDRPQHVAQDAQGFTLYSTQPTAAAPDGSIRWLERDNTWQDREANLMLWTQVVSGNAWGPGVPPLPCWDPVTSANVNPCVIAFADSVKIHFENPFLGTQLAVYDHVPGRPSQVLSHISGSWRDIETVMRNAGSDIFIFRGRWEMDEWLTGDTTFVANSTNGSSISIGEGATDPGRVWMWNALAPHPGLTNRLISNVVNIADYANNTADKVTGISLNNDGSALATRSQNSVFFFTNPMRLQGTFSDSSIVGGSGVALHPVTSFTAGVAATNWAAVGGAGADIVLIDTRSFRQVGSIPIGEKSVGPLKVVGNAAGDPADVVAHVFGITASGAVFEVAVRSSDISQ